MVAARLGTAKVNDARKQGGISIVTPDWLWACSERWERVSEKLFTLTKHSSVTRRPPAHCSSPEIAFAERLYLLLFTFCQIGLVIIAGVLILISIWTELSIGNLVLQKLIQGWLLVPKIYLVWRKR